MYYHINAWRMLSHTGGKAQDAAPAPVWSHADLSETVLKTAHSIPKYNRLFYFSTRHITKQFLALIYRFGIATATTHYGLQELAAFVR